MMNKHLQKLAGLTALALALHTGVMAQDVTPPAGPDSDTLINPRHGGYDEIIIRYKKDKDAKLSIEMKDGQVLVNGKPMSEFQNDNLSISKPKFKTLRDGGVAIFDRNGDLSYAPSPFRKGGVYSFDGRKFTSNRAFLGVTSIKPDSGPDGARIGEVSEGSAAEKAGLKQGDLITRVDDITIDGPESLADAIGRYKPEDKVTITFTRDGKEQKVTAILGKGQDMKVDGFNMPNEDFYRNFKDLMPPKDFNYNYNYNYNFGNSTRLGIHAQDTEDGKGVKVLDVDDESAASKAGMKEGDIITRFDGTAVNSATELAQIARESRTKPSVHVDLLRGGKTMSLDVKIPRKLKTADL